MKHQLDKSRLTELQLIFLDLVEKWLDSLEGCDWEVKAYGRRKTYSFEVEVKPRRPGSVAIAACAERGALLMFVGDRECLLDPKIEEESASEISRRAIALLDAATCGRLKIITRKASGKPCKWTWCLYENGEWKRIQDELKLLFNWFGHRSTEEFIINRPEADS